MAALAGLGGLLDPLAALDDVVADEPEVEEVVVDADIAQAEELAAAAAGGNQDAGRTTEAITMHEQNLAARERILGNDHPRTLSTRDNHANAYRAAGRTAREDKRKP